MLLFCHCEHHFYCSYLDGRYMLLTIN